MQCQSLSMVVFCKRDTILPLKPGRGKLSKEATCHKDLALLPSLTSVIRQELTLHLSQLQLVHLRSSESGGFFTWQTDCSLQSDQHCCSRWVDRLFMGSYGHSVHFPVSGMTCYRQSSDLKRLDLNYSSPQLPSFLKLVLSVRIQSGGSRHDIFIRMYPHV